MMLDTADNKVFFPRFYDIDTICSYDNSGQLKFDVDIEMEQGYWNTSSSRLWTRIRDLMHDDIVTTYNDMRQNGVSYENMMKYIYDEQIAKIPQVYFNKDYDIKYAPFADSYIGMAHGDTYEHVKRWLKQRFTFVDTLFDYAPSYNNDVLTIRANTTELMTLEIETYTPVYQHLSWYNGQMDKKKIDGKVSVEFSGTAQAATDQEVLIYGGSNVKSIKGITSMNPNRMLIGSATKLVEIDAHDCPLLADINANKANLSPHEYLNKVDLSNCPLLEGNLRLNNSPLVQEINIKGTNITGMNLPSSIRNLQVLRLPNTMTDLTLNDASMLHTLDFDEGVALQSISMTNCNALENVINFDLLQTPSITLNNSYNTAAELYFRDTTNLSLSNMSNLERVIFTPNNEYETFELINVANAPDYKVTTFNCPKLSTFMTTAPYRESYNDGDYGDIQPDTTFTANSIDISSTQFTDVKLLCTTDTNTLKLPITVKNFYCDSSFDLDTDYLEDGEYDVVHGELVEPYTTDYEGEVLLDDVIEKRYSRGEITYPNVSGSDYITDKIPIENAYKLDIFLETGAQWQGVKFFDKDENLLSEYGASITAHTIEVPSDAKWMTIWCNNGINMKQGYRLYSKRIPNLIPSSADGSLIFSMYAPSSTVAPASGTWDLHGLEFDNFHTFGMNNDVKPSEDSYVKCYTDKIIAYHASFWGSNSGTSVTTSQNSLLMIFDKLELFGEEKTFTLIASDNKVVQGGHFNSGWSSGYSGTNGVTTFTWSTNADTPYLVARVEIANEVEWIQFNDVRIDLSNLDIREVATTSPIVEGLLEVNILSEYNMILGDSPTSITMPARYDDYNITIKNAYIAPKTHNTMLYPLLVNEDNPITGTLNYTNYAGKHLSWSFAYTDEEYVNITQPKDELLNSYEYKYNAFYDTEYEFDNPYEIARYTSSASGVLPSFNSEFTYTYDEIDNGDGTYTTKIYADSLDNLPTRISFADKGGLVGIDKLNMSKVTDMSNMFRGQINLAYIKDVSNWDVSNVTNMTQVFYNTKKLTSLDLSGWNTSSVTDMKGMFNSCQNLTTLDVSSFDTSKVIDMNNMFTNCSSLTSLDLSGLDTSKVTDMNSMFINCKSLTSLDLSGLDTSKVISTYSMFNGCTNLTSLDVSGFDTGNVTIMAYMFNDCKSLTSLNLSGFDTSNVTSMANMFRWCSGLTSLDVSGFETSKVTAMNNMFSSCSNLTSLDLSGFNTNNVTNMSYMFSGSSNLTTLDLSNFDTTNVTNMQSVFQNCYNLTTLDVSNFDTSKVTTMYYMFGSCTSLTSLDVSNFDTSNVTNMSGMFYICSKLTSLNLSNWSLDNVNTIIPQLSVSPSTSTLYGTVIIDESTLPSGWVYDNALIIAKYTANATGVLPTFNTKFTSYTTGETDNGDGTYTVSIATDSVDNLPTSISFYNITTVISVERLSTSNVTNMRSMFYGCSGLTSLNVSRFDTSNVTTMYGMFQSCSNLTSLDLSSFDTSNVTDMGFMFKSCSKLTSLDISGFDTSNVTNMGDMFSGCRILASLDVDNFDTSNVTNMENMFQNCNNLTSLDVSGFDTSSATGMRSMFSGCNNLISLDVSGFDTSNVTTMYYMFSECRNLTSLDLSSFDTSNVTTIHGMFQNCNNLTSLDLSSFDTSKITSMQYMFQGCSRLTSLDLGSFNTSNVTNMEYTFQSCSQLTSLNVSNFNTTNVTGMNSMFYGCSQLTSLDLSSFDISNVTDMGGMFIDCSALIELDSMQNISTGLDLSSTILDATSLLDVINNLATISTNKKLTLGSTLLAKLTEDQIAIATNKGWTVA